MLLRLLRTSTQGNALCGTLYIDGKPFCTTLENATKAIPTSFYPVRVTMSAYWKELLPILDNVIGRTGIRIHPGNSAKDSEGCILVGEADNREQITGNNEYRLLSSRRTFNTLMPLLLTAQRQHEEIWIEVVDETPETISLQRGYDLATYRGLDNSVLEPTAVYVFQDTTKKVK